MSSETVSTRDTHTGSHQKRPYHHGDLRHALVQATKELVEQKGSAHFSVAQAARQAGVSSAAPYRHFKDREEMLDAVAEDGLMRLSEIFDEVTAPHEPGSVEAILALGLAYIAFALREPAVFRLMFAEHQSKSEATCEAGERCKCQLLTQVAANLGVTELNEAVVSTAFPLWSMVHGIAFLRIEGKIGPDGKVAPDGTVVPVEPILRAATVKLLAR